MMDLPIPVSDAIESYYPDNNAYVFKSQRGLLRVSFVKDKLVHIEFTVNNKFGARQPWIMENVCVLESEISEDETYYYLNRDSVKVMVSKAAGTVSFAGGKGQILFTEDGRYAREFEPVQEYITLDDGSVKSSEVVTADGVKKVVSSANRKPGRLLYRTRLHFMFEDGEAIYGLGQSEEGVFNLRGHVKYLHQANRKIAIPVMMSSKGYGILFPSGSAGMFSDNENGTFYQTEACENMEYYFLGGDSIDESISMFRFLTGKAELLPRWAYGYLQSKERYESENEILDVAAEFKKRGIGIDAIILDWLTWKDNMWGQKTLDLKRFPNPDKMMNKLHADNLRLMISIWPNMTAACDNYKEFKEAGLLFPGTEVYNALDEKARKLYWKQVNEGLYKYGIDGFWCDSSEPFTPEWTKPIKPEAAYAYYDFIKTAQDSMPYDEINAYGFYHAKGIYDGQRETNNNRIMNLTRNGYPGSQRFGTVLWSGDIAADYDTLRKQVAEGLNMCASGIPYWTLDIGAFFVKKGSPWFWNGEYPEGLDNLGYRELYVRWYQYGAFLPIFRSHGTDCPREPWQFGEAGDMFYDAIIKANELRYKLMPYIYSVAYKVWRDDYTMMRLLAFDYRNDDRVKDIYDQFMFGPSLMVCPVLSPMYYDNKSNPINMAKTREVYFPEGNNWIDIRDNKVYKGGEIACVSADIYSIPVFAKEGSIIPTAEGIKSTAELDEAKIVPVVYGNITCSFELYEDSGDGYEYRTGDNGITVISYSSEKGITLVTKQ